jgi:hypothetical protein
MPKLVPAWWLVLALAVGACSALPEIGGVHPLVTITFHGGLCADGAECASSTDLNSDGTVTGDAKPPNVMGRMTPGVLAQLQAAIAAADFDAIRSKPFTGTCPTAFDGQEAVFTFHLASGDVRLAECEFELDQTSPLFDAVGAALAAGVGPSN